MQLSFFAADSEPASLADLEGLLAGPAQVVRAGDTARLSVVLHVPAAEPGWRAATLLDVFRERDLGGECTATVDDLAAVRTDFRPELLPLTATWARGAMKAPPPGFTLDGPRLRLWAIAAGRRDDYGYLFTLGESDEAGWAATGAALAAAGVPATLVGPRAGGPAYRVTGQRRLRRLAELVGDPPPDATEGDWPRAP